MRCGVRRLSTSAVEAAHAHWGTSNSKAGCVSEWDVRFHRFVNLRKHISNAADVQGGAVITTLCVIFAKSDLQPLLPPPWKRDEVGGDYWEIRDCGVRPALLMQSYRKTDL